MIHDTMQLIGLGNQLIEDSLFDMLTTVVSHYLLTLDTVRYQRYFHG